MSELSGREKRHYVLKGGCGKGGDTNTAIVGGEGDVREEGLQGEGMV